MATRPNRLVSLGAALLTGAALMAGAALLGAGAASAQPAATPAKAAPATVCMTARQFYEGLDSRSRATTYRGGSYPWGVMGVRCAGRWAAAGVLAAGQSGDQPGFEYTGFETRAPGGRWHEVSRAAPCETHEVPRSLYRYACESN